jgi:hypothetical protein
MKLIVALSLISASSLYAQDLAYRVREELLDQGHPVIVNVSTHSVTTLQFPAPIQSLESDGFTSKPNEEAGEFYISPGVNWVSIRSLRPGAQQNLGVVIAGKVYEVLIQTVEQNDFSVLFQFTERAKPAEHRNASVVWSPMKRPLP